MMAHLYTSSLPRRTQLRPRITSDVFLPPNTSPDSSINDVSQTPPSNAFTSTSRKRARNDGHEMQAGSPYASGFSPWTNCNHNATTTRPASFTSPPPLTNSKYRLAGGLDTPTQTIANLDGTADDESDHDFRKQWHNEQSERVTRNLDMLSGERNGRPLVWPSATEAQPTWSQFVLDVVGTVAVKVWDFCRASAFRGFRAGGGEAYAFPNIRETRIGIAGIWSEKTENSAHADYHVDSSHQSQIESFNSSINAEEQETRPAKRLQTNQGSSWVLVKHNIQDSPCQRVSSLASSPRSSSHRSFLPRPSTSRTNATRLPRPSTGHHNITNFDRAPATFNNSSASFAQPRSPASMSPSVQRTPGSAEKRRLPVKKGREEFGGDESMRKLNDQLKAMIREGKAALATRVEVHDEPDLGSDVEDEGYAEGSDGTGKGW